jgi:hypothetical protein
VVGVEMGDAEMGGVEDCCDVVVEADDVWWIGDCLA